jgi:hypothetical protein
MKLAVPVVPGGILERLADDFTKRGWHRIFGDFESAWSASAIFRIFIANTWGNTAALDLDTGADTIRAALFNNSITPDKDVSAANSAYNVAQWGTANEVYHAGQWAQAGVALASQIVDVATSGVIMFDAADTSSGSAATLASVYGNLIYDDTLTTPVADQGLCYNYYGGSQGVTAGTFTVIWNSNGVMRVTV